MIGNSLNHILRNSINLLLGFHIGQRIEIETTIAFNKPRPNAFEFVSVLSGRTIVLAPDKVKHLLNTKLRRHNVSLDPANGENGHSLQHYQTDTHAQP